jgi:hypothetical protein
VKVSSASALALGGTLPLGEDTGFIWRQALEDIAGNLVQVNSAFLIETGLAGDPPEVRPMGELEALFEE